MNTAGPFFVLTVVVSLPIHLGLVLHEHHQYCEERGQGPLIRTRHGQCPTVAGSYFPGEMHWIRPQYSIAPCFRMSSELSFKQGCPAWISIQLNEECASDLYSKTSPYPDIYKIDVFQFTLISPVHNNFDKLTASMKFACSCRLNSTPFCMRGLLAQRSSSVKLRGRPSTTLPCHLRHRSLSHTLALACTL